MKTESKAWEAKKKLVQRLPSFSRKRLLWTMYAFSVHALNLLEQRYGSLEAALEKEKDGAPYVAIAIRSNIAKAGGKENRGGMVHWISENYPQAATAHPFIIEARDHLEKANCLKHHSRGRGHVGKTEVFVYNLVAMVVILENVLGVKERRCPEVLD